eukprot:gene1326-427_t
MKIFPRNHLFLQPAFALSNASVGRVRCDGRLEKKVNPTNRHLVTKKKLNTQVHSTLFLPPPFHGRDMEELDSGAQATVFRAHRVSDGASVAVKLVETDAVDQGAAVLWSTAADSAPPLPFCLTHTPTATSLPWPLPLPIPDELRRIGDEPPVVCGRLTSPPLSARAMHLGTRVRPPDPASRAMAHVHANPCRVSVLSTSPAHKHPATASRALTNTLWMNHGEGSIAFVAQQLLEWPWRQGLMRIALCTRPDPWTCKFIDFGATTQLGGHRMRAVSMVGTPAWMAPEVIDAGQTYGRPADVWSFGIMIYELAQKEPPHADKSQQGTFQAVTRGPPPRLPDKAKNQPAPWSAEFKDFVGRMLVKDPSARMPTEALLRHPFLKKSMGQAQFTSWVVNKVKERDAMLIESGHPDMVHFKQPSGPDHMSLYYMDEIPAVTSEQVAAAPAPPATNRHSPPWAAAAVSKMKQKAHHAEEKIEHGVAKGMKHVENHYHVSGPGGGREDFVHSSGGPTCPEKRAVSPAEHTSAKKVISPQKDILDELKSMERNGKWADTETASPLHSAPRPGGAWGPGRAPDLSSAGHDQCSSAPKQRPGHVSTIFVDEVPGLQAQARNKAPGRGLPSRMKSSSMSPTNAATAAGFGAGALRGPARAQPGVHSKPVQPSACPAPVPVPGPGKLSPANPA